MATNLTIKRRRNEPADKLVKRFIRKTKKSGIIDEVKERRYFKKPSERKREARRRAIARQKKEILKANKLQKRLGNGK
tara:strand:+ start:5163 stop:5396 length:234 start_codon:yes stop_codon:yes gene_type:complete